MQACGCFVLGCGVAADAADSGGRALNGRAGGDELPSLTETLLAPETADAEALAYLGDWSRLPLLGDGRYQQQSSHDRNLPPPPNGDLDPIVADGNRDMNNFICKSADAQLGELHNPPLAFDAQRCEDAYVHGAVMARYQGSGVLRRLWLTSTILSLGVSFSNDLLRIYVDDDPDNAFYFLDSPRSTAFAQSWSVVDDIFEQPSGTASFCRWQVLGNELDFQASFQGTFEVAQSNTAIVELHRTLAFMYLAPP